MINKVKKIINQNIDLNYQKFTKKLLPNVDNVLGVRLPVLRNIAKNIIKDDPIYYLDNVKNESFEEIMLEGYVIGYLKQDESIVLKYIDIFLPKINNWSVCDSFCSSLKIVNKNKDYFFGYLCSLKNNNSEFKLRFMFVMFLDYFIDIKYIDKIFKIIDDNIYNNYYYANMSIAWFLSMCYIKYKDETMNYLKKSKISDWVYNKTLQKIIESNQISNEEKLKIKNMKRK